jgi:hypothetical protein
MEFACLYYLGRWNGSARWNTPRRKQINDYFRVSSPTQMDNYFRVPAQMDERGHYELWPLWSPKCVALRDALSLRVASGRCSATSSIFSLFSSSRQGGEMESGGREEEVPAVAKAQRGFSRWRLACWEWFQQVKATLLGSETAPFNRHSTVCYNT